MIGRLDAATPILFRPVPPETSSREVDEVRAIGFSDADLVEMLQIVMLFVGISSFLAPSPSVRRSKRPSHGCSPMRNRRSKAEQPC